MRLGFFFSFEDVTSVKQAPFQHYSNTLYTVIEQAGL